MSTSEQPEPEALRRTNLSWLAGSLPVNRVFAVGFDVARALDRLDSYGLSHGHLDCEGVVVVDTPGGARAVLVETAWENDPDPGRDIVGLGRVLFEMISGELPDGAGGALDFPRHAPEGLRQVIDRCLQPDPGRRYASLTEAIAALEWAEAEYHRTKDDYVIDERWEHWFTEGEELGDRLEELGARRGREADRHTRLRAWLSSLAVGLILLAAAAAALMVAMK